MLSWPAFAIEGQAFIGYAISWLLAIMLAELRSFLSKRQLACRPPAPCWLPCHIILLIRYFSHCIDIVISLH
jgi:hypothetical protein